MNDQQKDPTMPQNQPPVTQVTVNPPQEKTEEEKKQAKVEQLKKAREAKQVKNQVQAQARISHPDPVGSKADQSVEEQKPPEYPKEVSSAGSPEEQGIDPNEKISIVQFRSMSATSPDVNQLFHKLLPRLAAPKATALEMRRLGHWIDYDEK